MKALARSKSENLLRLQAELFQALAHPARLLILQALREGDLCVCDLVSRLERELPEDSERTGVSKHLSVLRRLGIVSKREEAQKRIYHLEAPCLINALNCTVPLIERRKNA